SKEKIIYFNTNNKHKFEEVRRLFQESNVKYEVKQLNMKPIEIQAENLKDVAIFKLKSIKQDIEGSVLVEDAGFFVDKPLNGFPGVYSSYVMKTIGNEGILKLIDDFEATQAHFTAVIAFYYKPLDDIFIFEGNVHGKVSPIKKGNQGFGFDPIFLPNECPDKTFAQLSTKEKNQISHRGRALKKLIEFLKNN
ncbi:MAG: XTP/dITP diphosphatase, partial [Candidatus Heimdallarchaeaceae archaeon]